VTRIGIILGIARSGCRGRNRILDFAWVTNADVKVVSEGANK
jgi:hypothetical protein